MKYTKRLALNRFNPSSNVFAVEIDGTIVTTSDKALELPNGTTGQRPLTPVNGEIRYNNTLNDGELYNIDGNGTGWERIKTNRQTTITPQSLGSGNYQDTIFGPLSYDVSISKPQNVLVFVDNVYQIPTTNYTLVNGTSTSIVSTVTSAVSLNDTTINVSTLTNISIGMTVTAPSGLANGTTVTSIDTLLNTISIDPAATGPINISTALTLYEPAGTYIEFTSAVPNKPVFVLLGFDGYSPPNS